MKNILFIVFLYLVTPSNAQNKFPKGSYMNIDEIVKKSPSKKMDLTIQKRSKGDIKMNGGNDFKLTSTDQSISNKEIKKKILAYSNGDSLYINGHMYKVQKWYAPVIKYGRYLVFVGGISQEEHLYNYQIQETNSATFWSSFGAIGGGIQGVKSALLRFPYILDTKENELLTMSEYSVRKLLSETDLKLLSSYDSEKLRLSSKENNEDQLLLLKYVDMLNKTVQ